MTTTGDITALTLIGGGTAFLAYGYFLSDIKKAIQDEEKKQETKLKKSFDSMFSGFTDIFKNKFEEGFGLLEDKGKEI